MPSEVNNLASIAIVLCAALAASVLAPLIRLPGIIGYLGAGVLLGPSGFGLIRREEVGALAEMGLVLLLFTIGLELSPTPLIQMGRRLLLVTVLQMGLTTGVVTLALMAFETGGVAAGLVGVAVSLSSTAIVLRHLSDRGEAESVAGAITIGILLLQDIAVILLLIVLPLCAGAAQESWTIALLKIVTALGSLVGAVLVCWKLTPVLVRVVLRRATRESMTLLAVAAAGAGAWATAAAGWSPALGACIAGLLLASTDVRHQLSAEAAPFREVFTALFFISIGMLVDLHVATAMGAWLPTLVVAVVIAKSLLATGAVAAAGWPLRLAAGVGLGLGTISEFSFVLLHEANRLGLVSRELFERTAACTIGSMLVGALLIPASPRVSMFVSRLIRRDRLFAVPEASMTDAPRDHVVVVGYGLNGQNVARVLAATRIPCVVVELNPELAAQARAAGHRVLVGDAARESILLRAGLGEARALVIVINDRRVTRHIVAQAHKFRSELFILARTRYITELEPLYRLGADLVIPEEFETSIEIFSHLLKVFAVPDNVIEQQVELVRAGRYSMLRGRSADRAALDAWRRALELAVTQTYLLDEGSHACGRTIADLALRSRTGVTIVAVTRGGKPLLAPQPELRLEPGDVLVLVGSHLQLEQAKRLLAARSPVADDGGDPVRVGES